ncbi:hypothetical protein JHW43_006356 [Diplocarpon mali]|nr:hypothetical protein JHW43_006356 [Diplocarpon mali]
MSADDTSTLEDSSRIPLPLVPCDENSNTATQHLPNDVQAGGRLRRIPLFPVLLSAGIPLSSSQINSRLLPYGCLERITSSRQHELIFDISAPRPGHSYPLLLPVRGIATLGSTVLRAMETFIIILIGLAGGFFFDSSRFSRSGPTGLATPLHTSRRRRVPKGGLGTRRRTSSARVIGTWSLKARFSDVEAIIRGSTSARACVGTPWEIPAAWIATGCRAVPATCDGKSLNTPLGFLVMCRGPGDEGITTSTSTSSMESTRVGYRLLARAGAAYGQASERRGHITTRISHLATLPTPVSTAPPSPAVAYLPPLPNPSWHPLLPPGTRRSISDTKPIQLSTKHSFSLDAEPSDSSKAIRNRAREMDESAFAPYTRQWASLQPLHHAAKARRWPRKRQLNSPSQHLGMEDMRKQVEAVNIRVVLGPVEGKMASVYSRINHGTVTKHWSAITTVADTSGIALTRGKPGPEDEICLGFLSTDRITGRVFIDPGMLDKRILEHRRQLAERDGHFLLHPAMHLFSARNAVEHWKRILHLRFDSSHVPDGFRYQTRFIEKPASALHDLFEVSRTTHWRSKMARDAESVSRHPNIEPGLRADGNESTTMEETVEELSKDRDATHRRCECDLRGVFDLLRLQPGSEQGSSGLEEAAMPRDWTSIWLDMVPI